MMFELFAGMGVCECVCVHAHTGERGSYGIKAEPCS